MEPNLTALAINDLEFSYKKGQQSPNIIIPNWEVKQGQHVFLHGPSGSGKSTLLNLICGTLAAKKGKIDVIGTDIIPLSSRKKDAFRAQHIGVVFQQFNLIPYLSVMENIKLATYFTQSQFGEVNQRVIEILHRLSLPTDVGAQRADQLSVGQQQRVAIARALINKPELIIADEPTSALDEETRQKFMSLLKENVEQENSTLIFVSHDRTLQQFFDSSVDFSQLNQSASVSNDH